MRFIRCVILIIGLVCYNLPSFSQDEVYGSVGDLINDVYGRNSQESISFMENYLSSIEKNLNKQSQDSAYVGMISLLVTAYIQNNQPYLADSLLSHSINYMIETKRTSDVLYLLYSAYGSLYFYLQNYNLATTYYESAIQLYNETNLVKGATYAVMLSVLAACHGKLGNLHKAYLEIEEAIDIIENSEEVFSVANKRGIFQKAGTIYYELKMYDKAENITRQAYELSKRSNSIGDIINSTLNLAIFEQNQGRYKESIELLKELEQLTLTVNDRVNLYSLLYVAYYILNNEEETVKYAQLYSRAITDSSSLAYSSFPISIVEDYWEEYSSHLMGLMGTLNKYSSNHLVREMCYNNALFIKNLSFDQMDEIRSVSGKNKDIGKTVSDIKNIKTVLFGGNPSLYDELYQQEQLLIRQIREDTDYTKEIEVYTWDKVKQSLRIGECAIEIVPYIGISENNNDDDELPQKYGALILFPGDDSPQFIELCTYDQLREIVLNTFAEQELGVSQLYRKETECVLYNLFWNKIEPCLDGFKTLYISPVFDFLYINFGFIPCPDNKYVNEKISIRMVSSTSSICKPNITKSFTDVAIYGGIEYSKSGISKDGNSLRNIALRGFEETSRGSFGYLSATKVEADSIHAILTKAHFHSILYEGISANESSFRKLDENAPSIIHIATHGFYLEGYDKYEDYFSKLIPYSYKDPSLLYSGLLLAEANTAFSNPEISNAFDDGIITAEEVSWMDLSDTELVVLSACESAVGVSYQEGIGGLFKAFKKAGVSTILGSLWKVPDNATAMLMISFYKNLVSGMEIHSALLLAQREVSLIYPDPFYWAGFVLLD